MPLAAGLYYFVHEAENLSRPPVILIHGAGGTHLNWPPQVRRLAGQRIFALDLPGHGKSAGIGRQSILEYARDVVEFMQALKLRSAVMVGHSMGSAIALTLALHFPKRVLGLGLLGAGAKLRVAPAILETLATPNTFAAGVQMVIDAAYAAQSDSRLKELGAQRMAETRPPVLYGDFLACDEFNVMDSLARIHVPTLILVGAEDRLTPPRYAELLHSQIAGSTLKVVPNAGHMVMLEQPHAVATALAEFLGDISFVAGGVT
jgi:pimeloyl-ACP methyl ester carboxylesterase